MQALGAGLCVLCILARPTAFVVPTASVRAVQKELFNGCLIQSDATVTVSDEQSCSSRDEQLWKMVWTAYRTSNLKYLTNKFDQRHRKFVVGHRGLDRAHTSGIPRGTFAGAVYGSRKSCRVHARRQFGSAGKLHLARRRALDAQSIEGARRCRNALAGGNSALGGGGDGHACHSRNLARRSPVIAHFPCTGRRQKANVETGFRLTCRQIDRHSFGRAVPDNGGALSVAGGGHLNAATFDDSLVYHRRLPRRTDHLIGGRSAGKIRLCVAGDGPRQSRPTQHPQPERGASDAGQSSSRQQGHTPA